MSCPNAKASIVGAISRQHTRPKPTTAAHSCTSVHDAPDSDPSNQNSTPRVCSALADDSTTNDVNAENSWVPATPARTTRSVPPPAKYANVSTNPNDTTAPRNAPPDSVSTPPPTPSTATRTAPVDAPEDTPSTNGSARGLRNSDCRMAPHNANPAPHTAASTARGSRSCHTTPSCSCDTPESGPPRWWTTTA